MRNIFKKLFGKIEESKDNSSDKNNILNDSSNNSTDWKEKFDSEIIKHDEYLRKPEIVTESNSKEKRGLIYDSNLKYDYNFYRKTICSKNFSEDEKIDFLNESIVENNYDYLKHEYSFVSKVFLEEKKLASFLFDHFKYVDSKDAERPFRHIEFSIKNKLPNSKELIDKYLMERESLDKKYSEETTLPVYLFNLGFKSESVDLLEFFVNEHEKGNIKYINDGQHDEKSNPFALIGLLGNQEMAERVNRLGFRYFKNITLGYTYCLSQYLKYVNLPEYKSCIKYWLKKYPTLDQSNKSNINGYKSLIAGEGKYIAEELGMDYWNLFLNNKELWKDYEFERIIPDVAQFVMSPSLPENDKKEIIDYTLNNVKYLKSDNENTDSTTFRQYIKIIIKTKENISGKEIENYVPAKYNKYGNWNYIMRDINLPHNKTNLTNLKSDFIESKLIEDFEIDAYTLFQDSLGQFSIYKFLNLTNRIIWFDAEGGMFPLNYKQLFEDCFISAFETSGLSSFKFYEKQEMIEKECKYTLGFQLGNTIYQTSFSENSDWYNVSKMSLIINRCLIENKSEFRIISVDTGDQSALLGIFNPESFIPLMLKYNIRCWAVDGDNLVEMNYC